MARNFAHRPYLCDMAKDKRPIVVLCQMAARQIERAGVVIARDPDPAPPGHQADQTRLERIGQVLGSGQVIEAIAKADDRFRLDRRDILGQPVECFDCLIGRQ